VIPSDDPVLDLAPFNDDLDAAPSVSGQRDDVIVTEPSDPPGAPLADPLEGEDDGRFDDFSR
jgi:hypothetical protein